MPVLKIKRKIKVNTKFKTGLWLLLGISLAIVFTLKMPALRYVKYLIFPALLLITVTQNKMVFRLNKVDKNFIYYAVLWIVISLLSVLIGTILNGPGDLNYVRFFKEFYFINTALISVLLLFNISSVESIEKGVKYFIIFSFIYVFIIDFSKVLALASYRSSIFYFVTPPTENHYTTIFGAAFIFYLLRKNKLMAFLCLILTVVGAKRIIFIAVFAVIGLYFMLRPFRKVLLANKPLVIIFAILINLLVGFALYGLSQGVFDDVIFKLTGIPPNWLFSGRVAMYKDVFDYVGNVPLLPKGLGYIGTLLVDKKIHYNDFFEHMHSDVLKYMIEFGLLLFVIVFGFMYKMALKHFHAFILIVYFNIFMFTDNPSILYEFYIFFFILLMLMLMKPYPKEHIIRKANIAVHTSLS